MDRLPLEIIAQILSYLPGIDVSRLKEINRTFRKAVAEYRDELKRPEVIFSISNRDSDPLNFGQMIKLEFKYGKRHWSLHYEHPKYITIESWNQRNYFDFFEPFFEKKKRIEERTFSTVLDYIFEKADLAEFNITGMTNEDCVTIIMERIKRNKPRILSLTTCPFNYSSKTICGLMKTVAYQRRKTREVPTTTVIESPEQIVYLARHLGRINAISTLYNGTVLQTTVGRTSAVLLTIAEAWINEPCFHFYFDLHVKSYAVFGGPMQPFGLPGIQDNFKMTRVNTELFEYCIWDGRESFIVLQDIQSGHILKINKTGIIPPTRSTRINHQPAGTVMISLESILNNDENNVNIQ